MDHTPLAASDNSQKFQEPSHPDVGEHDSVRIAATALSDMRAASSRSGAGPSQAATGPPVDQAISRLPSVFNHAVNLYESSKASSRIVSYGAGMVESGVQAISKPVLDRLPTRVLNYGRADPSPPVASVRDEPQSMQVDLSARDASSSDAAREEQKQRALSWTNQQRETNRRDGGRNSASSEVLPPNRYLSPENEDDERMEILPRDRPSAMGHLPARTAANGETVNGSSLPRAQETETTSTQLVSRKGGWHTLMIEAGGISAAVSDESMRKLKYCLEWLQWATANLDTQITLLETFIASINATVTGEPVPSSATVSPEALQHYMGVKRNVVNTIRQVVEVVGKYAGGSLPEPAKEKVKGFILSLPGRWSEAVRDAGLGNGWEAASAAEAGTSANAEGLPTSRASPPSGSNPRKRNRLDASSQSVSSEAATGSSGATVVGTISAGPSSSDLATSSRPGAVVPPTKRAQLLPPTAGAARHAANRVLTLAEESLHAVKGVTAVFRDTLDRADTWVERLRRVGYNNNRRYVDDSDHSNSSNALAPPSLPLSPAVSSPRSPLERRRLQMTPRELHLEALARSIPSVGPYGPYGTGNTPPMSPVLGPQTYSTSNGNGSNSRKAGFPFDNPAPNAPGYGWVGGRRKSDSGLSAVPTLSLSETGYSARSRAGSMSQYESSTGESLPPSSVMGSTSSVAGDDELDEDGEYDTRKMKIFKAEAAMDADDDEGIDYRVRKRRRKEEDLG